MRAFLSSAAGRLLCASFAVAFLGTGASVAVGGSTSVVITAIVFPIAVAMAIVAVATASSEHWTMAIAAAIGLPMALFTFASLVFMLLGPFPVGGYVLLALGAASLAAALLPRGDEPREMERPLMQQPAH